MPNCSSSLSSRKGAEVGFVIEVVHALGTLQKVDNRVCHRGHQSLVNYLDQVTGNDQLHDDVQGTHSIEADEHYHRCVNGLADHRRTNRTRPEIFSFCEEL